MDRFTRNQRLSINKRKTFSGLPLLHIPKRRGKTTDKTVYVFPDDLEESFLQGEIGGKLRTENVAQRKNHRNTVDQRRFHYLTDGNTSLNSHHSPLANKHVFDKAYSRRKSKSKNHTTAELDQTVPESEALYRDIQDMMNEDYSPFMDELDEEEINYQGMKIDHILDAGKLDEHVTKEMMEEFKYEYNGTQHQPSVSVGIRSNLQVGVDLKARDSNITHKNTNENTLSNKEETVIKTKNIFSSMFTKSDKSSEPSTKERQEASSPWLTCRKPFYRNNPNENTAAIQEPKQLWCYVNDDYLIDEQIQILDNKEDSERNKCQDQQGIGGETSAKNETNLINAESHTTSLEEVTLNNENVNTDMPVEAKGKPIQSDINEGKFLEHTDDYQDTDMCERRDKEVKTSQQHPFSEMPVPICPQPDLATPTVQVEYENEFRDESDSEDYIPCSQMPINKRTSQFIGPNLTHVKDGVDNSGKIDVDTKEQNMYRDIIEVNPIPLSEDSDIISNSQSQKIQPSKLGQIKLFKHKLIKLDLSDNITENLQSELAKNTLNESAKANPVFNPKSQSIRDLYDSKGEITLNKNQAYEKIPEHGRLAIICSPDAFEDDMIIPPSGHSDETLVPQQVPDISRFLARKQMTGVLQE